MFEARVIFFEMLLKLVAILIAWHFVFVLGAHGPFIAHFLSVSKCNITSKPMDKNPSLLFDAEIYNSSTSQGLMRGKITVNREESYKKLQITSYIWEKNRWQLVKHIKNVGCNRIFFPLMAAAMNIKYNSTTCAINKGTYPFSNIDANKAVHLWKNTARYGLQLWTFEVTSSTNTIMCKEFESSLQPIDKSS